MNYRSREIADTPEKGHKRYEVYKAVLDQYKKSVEAGFYLEAITLMESIITDRLESKLIFSGLISKEEAFRTLDNCLKKLKNHFEILPSDLIDALSAWKDERNRALHEMAKIEEGDETTFDQRYSSLKAVAEDGHGLFKRLR